MCFSLIEFGDIFSNSTQRLCFPPPALRHLFPPLTGKVSAATSIVFIDDHEPSSAESSTSSSTKLLTHFFSSDKEPIPLPPNAQRVSVQIEMQQNENIISRMMSCFSKVHPPRPKTVETELPQEILTRLNSNDTVFCSYERRLLELTSEEHS